MGEPAKREATYRDVLEAPEHLVAEILDGDLHLHPRPAGPHASAILEIGSFLNGPFRKGIGGPGGWVILPEPELHLQARERPIVPDLAGWRRERMPVLGDEAAFELAPDWICEVLSPGTAAVDRSVKLPIYARARVGHAWLVEPILKTLEVFRLEAGAWRVVGAWTGDVRVRAEPFAEVELDLTYVWQR